MIDRLKKIDIMILAPAVLIAIAGLITMHSGIDDSYFSHQIIWIGVALVAFFVTSFIDFRFLRRRNMIVALFLITILIPRIV